MTQLVLDTDTLTLWLSGHDLVSSRIASTEDDRLAVSIITVEEVLTGWYTQIRRARDDVKQVRPYRWLQDSIEVFGHMHILSFDSAALHRF